MFPKLFVVDFYMENPRWRDLRQIFTVPLNSIIPNVFVDNEIEREKEREKEGKREST